jgi:hypothetical protein
VKTCTKCGEVKPLDDFCRDKRKPSGRGPRCRPCANAWQREFQLKHKAETGEWYSRQYTYERTCEICGATWQAKSKTARYCSTTCTNKIRAYVLTCDGCGEPFTAGQRPARWCSPLCKRLSSSGYRCVTDIPPNHPALVGATCDVPNDHPSRVVISASVYRIYIPDCRWCGAAFVTQQPRQVLCSRPCTRREGRAKRKARERQAPGAYTWTEVMSLFIEFGRCCAYCRRTIEGQPEPDHVIPLSRGGSNSITNILPSCRSCNGHKRDLLLHEWAEDRRRRDLPDVHTSWVRGDPLYTHLSIVLLEHQAA